MYTFDWGDAAESTTPLINSGVAASANHTWNKAGTYKIRAMATDSKGAFSEWSESLDITIKYTTEQTQSAIRPNFEQARNHQ